MTMKKIFNLIIISNAIMVTITRRSVLLVFFCLCGGYASTSENNVCPTFKDYYTIKHNPHCWYDVAAEKTSPEIIAHYGYPVKEYKVKTKDGYILTIFRIPSEKKSPVLLQHGLVSTSSNFLGLGKDSLAFVLADAGYDVWLSNYRGNQYAEEHVNLTVHDYKFWDHSMDEVALYDLPAIIETIEKTTGKKGEILFVGHSLGSTIALMYASEYPEAAKEHIRFFLFMSPAYTLTNMISPMKGMGPIMNQWLRTAEEFDLVRILSQAETARKIVRLICLESPVLMRSCLQFYNLFYGPHTQMGPEIIPVYFNQLPGGTALKIFDHSAQLLFGHLSKYNYAEKNLKVYGSITPPVYDIEKLKVPTYLIYSVADWATTKKDAWNLYHKLPKDYRYGIHEIKVENFNHIDFIFGRYAKKTVYDHVLEVLDKVYHEDHHGHH